MTNVVTELLFMLDNASISGLVVLVATLCFVGRWMVGNDQTVRRFGVIMAGVTLFLYGTYRWVTAGSFEPFVIQGVFFRSLIAAGLTLGFFWITGVGAFFCGRRLTRHHPNLLEKLAGIWRGWVRQPIGQLAPQRAELERNEVVHDEPEIEFAGPSQKELRERKRQEKLKTKRDDFRYELRLLYNKMQKDGQPVFLEAEFESLMDSALAPVDEPSIIKRVDMLRTSLQSSADANNEKGPKTIEEIGLKYQKERIAIQESEISTEDKELLLARVNMLQGRHMDRHMKDN